MKYGILALMLSGLLVGASAVAQETSGMTIEQMVFCAAVENRIPSGADTAFASTVENVCCFVAVAGAADTTTITHVWYFGDREIARVELAVKSRSWHTWSSKKILPEWQGTWRVDVLGPTGEVLKSGTFAVKP
ncbi:MAG: DUF2914 domain-containing protein [Candidatus Krumholzibacteria bacterium]|nr:DUF2914 domain-containing protein [Candidatus Krumholzibacteria bacterium]